MPVGLLQGAVNTRVGKGSGPESAKPHAALEEPAFWIRQYPERAVGGRLLIGRQAEGPMGCLLARLSWPAVVSFCQCLHSTLDSVKGFLEPGHHAEFGVRPKNKCRNSTVYERLCK